MEYINTEIYFCVDRIVFKTVFCNKILPENKLTNTEKK